LRIKEFGDVSTYQALCQPLVQQVNMEVGLLQKLLLRFERLLHALERKGEMQRARFGRDHQCLVPSNGWQSTAKSDQNAVTTLVERER
jgi:hypothetical protein